MVSEEDGKAVFYGLADGTYYVKELESPEGYILSNEVLTVVLGEELNENGHVFEGAYVNTPVPEYRDISGSKTWDDDNDKADARSDSITVNLYQNADLYESKVVTAVDDWAWRWSDLPKNDENGDAYVYTIDEDKVEYYTPTYYTGNFNITNTFIGEEGAEDMPASGTKSGPEKGGDQPRAGNTSNIALWLAMAAVLIAFRRRKRS